MALQIRHPQMNTSVIAYHYAFPIWGRADQSTVSVSGTCWPVQDPSQTIQGTTVFYYAEPGAEADVQYRWVILFRVPGPGDYQLTVTGSSDDGTVATANVTFSVPVPVPGSLSVAPGHHMHPTVVTVNFPSNGDNITDDADDFTPYGGLTQHPLGTVSLKSTTGNSVQLLYSYGDYKEYDIWTAQFATVPKGTYTLHAADSTGAGVNVSSLTVT